MNVQSHGQNSSRLVVDAKKKELTSSVLWRVLQSGETE